VHPDLGFVIHTSWSGFARMAIDSAMKCTADSTKIFTSGCRCVCRANWYESATWTAVALDELHDLAAHVVVREQHDAVAERRERRLM
jgi:hypothetical protein